jgi:hypothetical protein
MRILLALLTVVVGSLSASAQLPPQPPLAPMGVIVLDSVRGRIDHMAVDIVGQRLFVACYGNNSVEVIDLRTGERETSLRHLKAPQCVVYVPDRDEIVVSCGGDGTCRVFAGDDYDSLTTFDFKDDADNMRLDRKAERIYVGFNSGALGVMDLASRSIDRGSEIRLAAHPEAFQISKETDRIYVNIPEAKQIAVVKTGPGIVEKVWPLVAGVDALENFPMAIDDAHNRAMIGCRLPPSLTIRNLESGERVANLPCRGDVDDVFHDSVVDRIYAICGEGFIVVYEPEEHEMYRILAEIPTSSGARTGTFVSDWGYLYVAAPATLDNPAAILLFGTPK